MNKKMLKNELNEFLLGGEWQAVRALVRAMFMFNLAPVGGHGAVEGVTRIK